jgi:hypothetical protein
MKRMLGKHDLNRSVRTLGGGIKGVNVDFEYF